jgi:hypothetical protein
MVDEMIHHYTDLTGLMGIVKCHELWATDVRYLNDTGESTYANDRIIEYLQLHAQERQSAQSQKMYENWIRIHNPLRGFVICFSRDRNDLGQWRGYGRLGYSLAFDRDALNGCKSDDGLELMLIDLVYEETKMKEAVFEILDERKGRVLIDEKGHFTTEGLMVSTELLMQTPHFKQHAFKSEQEVRAQHITDKPVGLKLRESQLGPTPYLAFKIGDGRQSALRGVMVGPTPHPVEAAQGVRDLLDTNGLNHVREETSDIPFRW